MLDNKDKFELITKLPFFVELDQKIIINNLNCFEIKKYRKGKYIFYQGDDSYFVFYLIKGKVSIKKICYKDIIFLGTFFFDKWFGIEEVLLNTIHFHDVIVDEDSIIISISKFNFQKLMKIDKFKDLIIKELLKNFKYFESKITLDPPEIKIIKFFLSYYNNLKRKNNIYDNNNNNNDNNNDNNVIIINITQENLADFLNLTRETVNKYLKKLEKTKIIKLQRGKIIILDKSKMVNVLNNFF